MSDLIVQPSYEGITGEAVLRAVPVAGNIAAAAESFGDGNIGSGVIESASSVLDVVGMIVNPIATLMSSCAAFLIDYMPPLKEALEVITGSPEMVRAQSGTWTNLGNALAEVAAVRAEATATLGQSWQGIVGDAYDSVSAGLTQIVELVGQSCHSVASGLQMAASVVEIVYEIVKSIIADLVGQLIQAVVVALATVGVGIPVVVGQCTAKIAQKVPQVMRWIEKLQAIAAKIDDVVQKLTQFQKVLSVDVTAVNGSLRAVKSFDLAAVNLVQIVQAGNTAYHTYDDARNP